MEAGIGTGTGRGEGEGERGSTNASKGTCLDYCVKVLGH